MADGRHIENHFFGYNSAPYCPIKAKIWSEDAESHAYEAGQVIKCLITKIQNRGRKKYVENGYTSVSAPRILQS